MTFPQGASLGKGPRYCRQPAYEAFAAQLPTLEETDSLVRAAVAVSMHELDDASPDEAVGLLEALAAEVSGRVRLPSAPALVARLHEVLFDEWGFSGNVDNYYHPHNSYLPRVLVTRRGIPVTLSLIYKSVAQKVGLAARGINAPVHFLAAVEVDGTWMIVDPYDRGRMLTRDEVFERLEKLSAAGMERGDDLLATATHTQWLARIILNLMAIFEQQGRGLDRLAMEELLEILQPGQ